MSTPMSRQFAFDAARPVLVRAAGRPWPRTLCLPAALLASLGLWVALGRAALWLGSL